MSRIFVDDTESGARFSECGRYRYSLWRREAGAPIRDLCAFVGLNPSTADETLDDPTIRRCRRFAADWGFRGIVMINAFAFRSTYPSALSTIPDPVGYSNDDAIRRIAMDVGAVVCCWGNNGTFRDRGPQVLRMLRRVVPGSVYHMGLTKTGQPKHPLYLLATTELQAFIDPSLGEPWIRENAPDGIVIKPFGLNPA